MNFIFLILFNGILLLIGVLLVAFVVFIIYAMIVGMEKGAPFVRTNREKLGTMLELARIQPNETVIDLGSGDGILLIEAARRGAQIVGLEINPFLVLLSRYRARRHSFHHRITTLRRDFWNYPLHDADIVFLYLLTSTNAKLREKLERELRPGARVVSNTFAIHGWTPQQHINGVYLYKR